MCVHDVPPSSLAIAVASGTFPTHTILRAVSQMAEYLLHAASSGALLLGTRAGEVGITVGGHVAMSVHAAVRLHCPQPPGATGGDAATAQSIGHVFLHELAHAVRSGPAERSKFLAPELRRALAGFNEAAVAQQHLQAPTTVLVNAPAVHAYVLGSVLLEMLHLASAASGGMETHLAGVPILRALVEGLLAEDVNQRLSLQTALAALAGSGVVNTSAPPPPPPSYRLVVVRTPAPPAAVSSPTAASSNSSPSFVAVPVWPETTIDELAHKAAAAAAGRFWFAGGDQASSSGNEEGEASLEMRLPDGTSAAVPPGILAVRVLRIFLPDSFEALPVVRVAPSPAAIAAAAAAAAEVVVAAAAATAAAAAAASAATAAAAAVADAKATAAAAAAAAVAVSAPAAPPALIQPPLFAPVGVSAAVAATDALGLPSLLHGFVPLSALGVPSAAATSPAVIAVVPSAAPSLSVSTAPLPSVDPVADVAVGGSIAGGRFAVISSADERTAAPAASIPQPPAQPHRHPQQHAVVNNSSNDKPVEVVPRHQQQQQQQQFKQPPASTSGAEAPPASLLAVQAAAPVQPRGWSAIASGASSGGGLSISTKKQQQQQQQQQQQHGSRGGNMGATSPSSSLEHGGDGSTSTGGGSGGGFSLSTTSTIAASPTAPHGSPARPTNEPISARSAVVVPSVRATATAGPNGSAVAPAAAATAAMRVGSAAPASSAVSVWGLPTSRVMLGGPQQGQPGSQAATAAAGNDAVFAVELVARLRAWGLKSFPAAPAAAPAAGKGPAAVAPILLSLDIPLIPVAAAADALIAAFAAKPQVQAGKEPRVVSLREAMREMQDRTHTRDLARLAGFSASGFVEIAVAAIVVATFVAKDELAASLALQVTGNLAMVDDHRRRFSALHGIEAIRACVGVHVGSPRVAKDGMVALRHLAYELDANKRRVLDSGSIATIVAAMGACGDSTQVQRQGCATLSLLAVQSAFAEAAKRSIVEAGGIAAVVAAMKAHRGDDQLVTQALKALGTFMSAGDARAAAREAGLPALIAAIDERSASRELVEALRPVQRRLASV